MHSGLVNLQGDPDVDAYRAARLDAITDAYADPSAKVSLRAWLKKCSYIAPASHGGTEDTTFRVTPFISTLAGALASELGLTRYSLVAAVLAGGLALLSITDAEHRALREQSDALLDEIAVRRKELTRRAKTAKTKKGKP